MAEGRTHKILKQVALRWVQQTGCVAFVCEMSIGYIGIVDVAGIKANGDVYIVEAKASNADMRSDMKDSHRRASKIYRITHSSMVDFVYYILADAVNTPGGLPDFIGILDQNGRVRRKAKRRERLHNAQIKFDDFNRFARTASWRAYGSVINGESEQMEFTLTEVS